MCDSGNYAVLVLLDLTAAFDSVTHAVLINRLEHCAGITGSALEGFNLILPIELFRLRWETLLLVMLY